MGKRSVIWADRARTDRDQILDYWHYERKNTEYATSLSYTFKNTAKKLAEMPSMGKYSVRFPGVRRWNFEHWVIYYKATQTNLYIARLWDTRRDPSELHL